MENTEKEKGRNYSQKSGSCNRLLAMVAVKQKMERSCISVLRDIHSSATEGWRAELAG
jgi:hypothetical protein